jgi:hypothetical protein
MFPLSELSVAFAFPGFTIFLSLLNIFLAIVCFLYRLKGAAFPSSAGFLLRRTLRARDGCRSADCSVALAFFVPSSFCGCPRLVLPVS